MPQTLHIYPLVCKEIDKNSFIDKTNPSFYYVNIVLSSDQVLYAVSGGAVDRDKLAERFNQPDTGGLKATVIHPDSPTLEAKVVEKRLAEAREKGTKPSQSPHYVCVSGVEGTGRLELYQYLHEGKGIQGLPEIHTFSDFEGTQAFMAQYFAKAHTAMDETTILDPNTGQVSNHAIKEWVRYSVNMAETAVCANALAEGLNTSMNWSGATVPAEQFEAMRKIGERHGKTPQITVIGTTCAPECIIERLNEKELRGDALKYHLGTLKGHAEKWLGAVAVVDNAILLDTTNDEYKIIAQKSDRDGEFEIFDSEAYQRFEAQASINVHAPSVEAALSGMPPFTPQPELPEP